MPRPKNSPERDKNIRKAVALAEEGVGQQEIGRRLGVRQSSVRYWLNGYLNGNTPNNRSNNRSDNAKHAVHFSSTTDEWTTPRAVVALVLEVLGTIDLDPCADAARTIPASTHFTEEDDGLFRDWRGKVYMNPPYGRDIEWWAKQLCKEFAEGRTTEAIALLPARTDTKWFRRFAVFQKCFVHGRFKFGESTNSAPFPSVIVYLGPRPERFSEVFGTIGTIYAPTT